MPLVSDRLTSAFDFPRARGTLRRCSRGRSGCTWWGASRWAAPRRSSAASPRCSATGCGGSPTARPARARTGSAGSTPSSARSRSSSPPARRLLLLPRAAAAAPALRRGGGRHGLRRARLRLGGDVLARIYARLKDEGVIPAALPLPRLAPDAARSRQRVRRARAPGRPRAGLRGADGARGRAHPRGHPGRGPRDPVGRPLRVRDARRRDRGVVRRRPRRHPRAAAAARRARAAARSSSATTSATATRSTATSPSRRTPRTSSRSRTRSATASSGR